VRDEVREEPVEQREAGQHHPQAVALQDAGELREIRQPSPPWPQKKKKNKRERRSQ
jgi:hypothetical protein